MIDRVQVALQEAESGIKLPSWVLELEGMSGNKVRQFLNCLCRGKSIRYLEVGVWKGATLLSAAYGNYYGRFYGIDNGSQFEDESDEFSDLELDHAEELGSIDVYDWEAFTIDLKLPLFKEPLNVYFYDGAHDRESHRRALTYFYPVLANQFIFVCDDWNTPGDHVQRGTMEGISECRLQQRYGATIGTDKIQDRLGWWNGLFVAVLEK